MEAHLNLVPWTGNITRDIRMTLANREGRGDRMDRLLEYYSNEPDNESEPILAASTSKNLTSGFSPASLANKSGAESSKASEIPSTGFDNSVSSEVVVSEDSEPAICDSPTSRGSSMRSSSSRASLHVRSIRELTKQASYELQENEDQDDEEDRNPEHYSEPSGPSSRYLASNNSPRQPLQGGVPRPPPGPSAGRNSFRRATGGSNLVHQQAMWNRQRQSMFSPGGTKGAPGAQTCRRNGSRQQQHFLDKYNLKNHNIFQQGSGAENRRAQTQAAGTSGQTESNNSKLPIKLSPLERSSVSKFPGNRR